MVPPLVAAATGVTLIAVGATYLSQGDRSATSDAAIEANARPGADTDIDPAVRAATADRGSRSRSRTRPMTLSEVAEAVTAEQQRQVEAAAAEEAARADRAERARAEARRTRWVSPLQNYQLLGAEDEGVGLAAESGTPVRSLSTGTIAFTGTDAEYGQMIVIEHWDGTLAYYCHLSSYERTGGEVAADELIGRVGNTGSTSASHLHLQIRPGGGDPVDPLAWLARRGVKL